MLIISDMLRGHTDTIILAHLAKSDSYGYEINKTISEKTQGKFELKEATLYTTFRRLEQAGLITSYWGEEGVGARRRYYAITEQGLKLYHENKADWQAVKNLIDVLISE